MTGVAQVGFLVLSLLVGLPGVPPSPAEGQGGVVRAVLFFSPTCPHCHEVITRDLPLFFQVHGGEPQAWMDESAPETERALYLLYNDELEILLIDATRPLGGQLYEASLRSHPIGGAGVPRLVMGDTVLVGSVQIPSTFHRLFADAAARGALDWPAIEGLPGLAARLPSAEGQTTGATDPTEATDTAEPAGARTGGRGVERAEAADTMEAADAMEPAGGQAGGQSVDQADTTVAAPSVFETIAGQPTSVGERFRQDLAGNSLAAVVLALMLASLVAVARGVGSSGIARPGTAIPLLAVIGIGVAAYLTYVEASGAVAVCGPVGNCNAVQQSGYARILEVPVGALGLAGYVAMIAAWVMGRRDGAASADWARVLLLAMAVLGTLFSVYLTFLEPFVIGATCAWCLTSAAIMTLLLWLSAGPGRAAWSRLRGAQA